MFFNQYDVVVFFCKDDDDCYWCQVFIYGVEYNFQVVFDEYVYYLFDVEGLGVKLVVDCIVGISKVILEVLVICFLQIDVEDLMVDGKKLVINKFQMCGCFVMCLVDYKDEEGGVVCFFSVCDVFNLLF